MPPEFMPLQLEVTWGSQTARHELKGPATIGRKDGCEVLVPLAEISRQHARIEPDGDGWKLVDLGSRNGVELNGTRVSGSAPLRNGDVLRMGAASARVALTPPGSGPDPAALGRTVLAARPIGEMLAAFDSSRTVALDRPDPDARGAALRLAADAAEALLQHEDLDAALSELLRVATHDLPAERAAIALSGKSQACPVVRASLGFEDEPQISSQVVSEVVAGRKAVLIEDVGAADDVAAGHTLVRSAVRSVIAAPLYYRGAVEGLIYLDNRGGGRAFKEGDLAVLAAIGRFAALGIDRHRTRQAAERQQKIQERLERYASPAVVERVIQTTTHGDMIAEERVVTVLFADLVGFTTLSEGRSPVAVTRLLNQAFDRLTQVVFAHRGTLDKYMGDGLMAFWGAPVSDPDHALNAARAALEMQTALAEINDAARLEPPLRMRVGLNTGPAIVGDIGSRKRRDYTVIGDTVNVASRLEGVATPGEVVIGEATRQAVADAFELEVLDPVLVKGRGEPVRPARLIGPR